MVYTPLQHYSNEVTSHDVTEESAVIEVVTCGQTYVYQLKFSLGQCPCLNGGLCTGSSGRKDAHRRQSQCRCPDGFIGKLWVQ